MRALIAASTWADGVSAGSLTFANWASSALLCSVEAMALIEQGRQGGDFLQQLGGPLFQVYRLAITLQLQARTPTFLDHAEEVGGGVAALVIGQQRAVIQRAIQQERVEEA